MRNFVAVLVVLFLLPSLCRPVDAQQYSEAQLTQWLKRFPAADVDKDGKLSAAEAKAFRSKIQSQRKKPGGVKKTFKVDPGWEKDRFPDHSVCYKSPDEIAKL